MSLQDEYPTVRTFQIGGASYHAGKLPGRKRWALVRSVTNCYEPVAYFRDNREAAEFNAWLDAVVELFGGAG